VLRQSDYTLADIFDKAAHGLVIYEIAGVASAAQPRRRLLMVSSR